MFCRIELVRTANDGEADEDWEIENGWIDAWKPSKKRNGKTIRTGDRSSNNNCWFHHCDSEGTKDNTDNCANR